LVIKLLLFIQFICFDMYPSIPAHIHPHMNKTSCYWKLMGDQLTMFIVNLVHTRDNGLKSIRYWNRNRPLSHQGLICMPWNMNRIKSKDASIPHRNTWWSSGWSEVSVAQYFFSINTYTYWFHQFSPSQCKLSSYYRFSTLCSW